MLEYVRPEAVGVSSRAVMELLDELERDLDVSEPHGLMLLRHGKVFAEGYWTPYAKGLVHGMQSLTKTYAGTAIGIAIQQKIVSLDDRIIELFPEEAAQSSGQPYLEELTVRHVLSMSTGMRKMSSFEGNWIVNFLNNPIVDKPGTTFFYNSVGSTLLGEIIRRKTGLGLNEFLRTYLYRKIGMDETYLKWLCIPDGLEIGGSGLYSTLENNSLLGLLYMNQGNWNGEQIIDKEFCRLASTVQIENSKPGKEPADGEVGYGFQMWMGLHPHTYCMAGAWGQFTIMCPDEDVVISFSGTTNDALQAASDTVQSKFWRFLEKGIDKGIDSGEDTDKLQLKLKKLALPVTPCQPCGAKENYTGTYEVEEGQFDLDMTTGGIMQVCFSVYPIHKIALNFENDMLFVRYENSLGEHELKAGMDGIARLNLIETPPFPCKKSLATAHFDGEDLVIHVRWIETCYAATICMRAKDGRLEIEKTFDAIDPMGNDLEHRAVAVKRTV